MYQTATRRWNSPGAPSLGKDLTEDMDEAPHGPEVFKDYPVVGTLKKDLLSNSLFFFKKKKEN